MKTTIAFHALMAAICTAAHSNALQTSSVRGSVEEREEMKRQLRPSWYDPQVEDAVDVNSVISKTPPIFNAGYDKLSGAIHISACVGLTTTECLAYAGNIYTAHPDWFGVTGGGLVADTHDLDASSMGYYYVGIPVDQNDIVASAGCMVHYAYDWCALDSNGDAQCTSIGPWFCTDGSGCLNVDDCCAQIQDGQYPKPDINDFNLQCYSHHHGGHENNCLMSKVVTMHTNKEGVVAIPASIVKAPERQDHGTYCDYSYVKGVVQYFQ